MGTKAMLIGLDGATFSVLDAMVARGVMPFLGRFMDGGVRAGLRTIVPPLTPPAWTSLMTGRTPGHHGVFDFFRMDSVESRHIRFSDSHDVAVPTIWEAATAANQTVTALNFPLMFPPPKVSGFVVPGWIPWRQLRLACHPADLFDRLRELPAFQPRELAMDMKLEERATEGCSNAQEYAPWIELHIRREQNWFEILQHLSATAPSDLTAVLFDGVDKLQHLCWRFIDCEPDTKWEFEWERQAHELCTEYFRRLDGIIERICEMVGPEATVVIASDHGFGPTKQVFNVNAWLERHGYLGWASAEQARPADGALLGVGHVARHTYLMDWTRTRAFATTPTSNGIFIVRDNGDGRGVPEDQYEQFRQTLVAKLLEERDPATGQPLVSRVYTREEAFDGPFMSMAPDLTLALADGGLVSILPNEHIVVPRPDVAGTHRPVGIFLAKGPHIRKGMDLGEISILDVAPTLLYALGLPVPENLEGRMPEDAFESEAMREKPVKTTDAATPMQRSTEAAPEQAFGEEAEAEVMKRLQELGYIE